MKTSHGFGSWYVLGLWSGYLPWWIGLVDCWLNWSALVLLVVFRFSPLMSAFAGCTFMTFWPFWRIHRASKKLAFVHRSHTNLLFQLKLWVCVTSSLFCSSVSWSISLLKYGLIYSQRHWSLQFLLQMAGFTTRWSILIFFFLNVQKYLASIVLIPWCPALDIFLPFWFWVCSIW